MAETRLRRSATDSILFGVCGGLADYLKVDPVLVRAGFVVLTFAGGSGIIVYLVLALIMPKEDAASAEPRDVVRDNLSSMAGDVQAAGRRIGESSRGTASRTDRGSLATVLGLLLVVIGFVVLMANLGFFRWWRWDIAWPAVLIGLGLLLVLGHFRRRG